jgi:hypothetical protein
MRGIIHENVSKQNQPVEPGVGSFGAFACRLAFCPVANQREHLRLRPLQTLELLIAAVALCHPPSSSPVVDEVVGNWAKFDDG